MPRTIRKNIKKVVTSRGEVVKPSEKQPESFVVKYVGSKTYSRWDNPSGKIYIFEGRDKTCEVLKEDIKNFIGGPFEISKLKNKAKEADE